MTNELAVLLLGGGPFAGLRRPSNDQGRMPVPEVPHLLGWPGPPSRQRQIPWVVEVASLDASARGVAQVLAALLGQRLVALQCRNFRYGSALPGDADDGLGVSARTRSRGIGRPRPAVVSPEQNVTGMQ